MKLSHWAKKQGISYQAAWNSFKRGDIIGAYQLPSGTIIVPEETRERPPYTIVYARVSSSQNKDNLNSQAKRVSQFCSANGWQVNEVVKETASGLNDMRPKLHKIFSDGKATRIVVEHKDRLTRFGFAYINALFDGEIVVINEVEESEADLVQDFVSLVTSFCARIYGKRRSKRCTEKLIKELSSD